MASASSGDIDVLSAARKAVPPDYTPTEDEIFNYYRAISEAVSIPIMLYNNPFYAGTVELTPWDIAALVQEGVRADVVYLDLGMSSMQVDTRERGFSYAYDAPLDMRMDTRQSFTAADLVNEWPEARIAQVLRRFGEERHAGGIAREIVRRRPLSTTAELVDTIKAGMPPSARFGAGHPAKRSFQAIRIAVNGAEPGDALGQVLREYGGDESFLVAPDEEHFEAMLWELLQRGVHGEVGGADLVELVPRQGERDRDTGPGR